MISIINGAYSVFACKEDELNPKYLDVLFKSKGFLDYVNDKANGGVRMNFKFEDMEAWEIPLPDIDEQNEIISQIEKQKAIVGFCQNFSQKIDIEIENEVVKFTLNGKYEPADIKKEALFKINQILADVWGVEFIEQIEMEVEDGQED
jgi:restriction endonuclease S subunit